MRMPLIAPAIPAAVRAQRELLGASEYSRTALARRLKRDITVGYLRWLGSVRNQGIVDASVALLNENLRVNESLFRNGKITQDQVLRARAELLQVDAAVARRRESAPRRRRVILNFLLNRPLDTPLENAEVEANVSRHHARAGGTAPGGARQSSGDRRAHAPDARQRSADQRGEGPSCWPTLSLGADGGIQGEEYEFGRGSNYYTVSLLLNWNLFDGGARRAAVRQANAIARRTATQLTSSPSRCSSKCSSRSTGSNTSADSLATAEARAEACARRLPHRQPQARRRRHQPGRIHRCTLEPHRRRAQSQRHAFRSARAPGRARLRHCRGHLAPGLFPMRTRTTLVLFTILHRRLRQQRCAAGREADAGAHPAGQPGPGGAADRHQRTGRHQARDAPVLQDGRRRAPHPRAGRRRRQAGPAARRNRADRSQRAGRAGAADGREGGARPEARREPVRRPGHQPRAAAGSAHAGRDGRGARSSPRSSTSVTR